MTTDITISLDRDTKRQAEELFADLGMNIPTAVNIFIRQSINRQKLPFTLRRKRIPNAETIAAIKEGRRLAHDPKTPRYKNVEELVKALHE